MSDKKDEAPKKKGGIRYSSPQETEDFYRFWRVKGRAPKTTDEINQWNKDESEDD